MTTYCFYHSSDLDGHCSGAIVACSLLRSDKIKINKNYTNYIDAKSNFYRLIPFNYG